MARRKPSVEEVVKSVISKKFHCLMPPAIYEPVLQDTRCIDGGDLICIKMSYENYMVALCWMPLVPSVNMQGNTGQNSIFTTP